MSELRTPLIAANWKMYKGPVQTAEFLSEFAGLYSPHEDRTVLFLPPYLSIAAFLAETADRSDLEVGVQDVHPGIEGAHTSGISASMAKEARAEWGLAGHSERRREFGDDDETVAAKLGFLLDAGLRPVLCVGETLEEREADLLEAVLERQIGTVLDGLDESRWPIRVVAYEPVWAIGTGKTATPGDAEEAHAIVRERIAERWGESAARATAVLYGGSVNPGNIASLLAVDGVDGVLVGGASLDPVSFAKICAGGED